MVVRAVRTTLMVGEVAAGLRPCGDRVAQAGMAMRRAPAHRHHLTVLVVVAVVEITRRHKPVAMGLLGT